jgi:3-deoxy-D-manno-octulosonic-acid transferase
MSEFRAEGEAATLLLTSDGSAPAAGDAEKTITLALPDDRSDDAARFADHWRPNVLIWTGGGLRPRLLDHFRDQGLTRILIDSPDDASLVEAGGPLLPGVTRALLAIFDEALCTNDERAALLARSGLPQDRIRQMNPLEPTPPVPAFVESDRQEMARALGTRPVWLCVDPSREEIAHIIAAHRQAVRRAHRLLLIIAAADPDDVFPALRDDGLDVAQRLSGEEPTFNTDVLLADLSELGLWYRLAPMTFVGGTLIGQPVRDPFEAAALGSAVIHGQAEGRFGDRFRALHLAGASYRIEQGAQLGKAVVGLLSADRAAQFAHAGWDVATRGAETMSYLTDRLREAIDRSGK